MTKSASQAGSRRGRLLGWTPTSRVSEPVSSFNQLSLGDSAVAAKAAQQF